MKIGIDTRAQAQSQYYHDFITELMIELLGYNSEHHFIIYVEKGRDIAPNIGEKDFPEHITLKELPTQSFGVVGLFQGKKVFEAEKFHMMIFFDTHFIPHGYTRPYILVLESLKDIFFPKKKWFERKLFSYKLKRSMKHCFKCICLDSHSPLELNEHLNISEENIAHIPGFFPKLESQKEDLEIDVRLKHNFKHPYLIYDSGNEVHNNFERILKSIKKLKDMGSPLHLIISCDATSSDLDIREKVIEYKLTGNIVFLGNIEKKFESSYYKQSHGVIYSSIYESFPLQFSKGIHYKKILLANDIRAHKEIMGNTLKYLDPLSVHTMTETLREHIGQELEETQKSYTSIMKQYNSRQSLEALLMYLE
ncbi:glycosyltransferase [Candidatus Gracilibacteria bacterium]|nr:glycosyltransferase [Candidatus Gracilibacteria bacterium]